MNAAFEPYRVILDYEALQDGFLDRIEDLNTTLEQIEMSGNLAKGNAQKLLTKNPGKAIARKRDHRTKSAMRTFGWESLGKMLKGTGMALVLVVDDERFAPLKEQLTKRKKPRQLPNGSMKRPTWLITKSKSIKMQVLRNQALSPKQRKRIAKIAARARWKKQRKSVQQIGNKVDDVHLVSTAAFGTAETSVRLRNERCHAGMLTSSTK